QLDLEQTALRFELHRGWLDFVCQRKHSISRGWPNRRIRVCVHHNDQAMRLNAHLNILCIERRMAHRHGNALFRFQEPATERLDDFTLSQKPILAIRAWLAS